MDHHRVEFAQPTEHRPGLLEHACAHEQRFRQKAQPARKVGREIGLQKTGYISEAGRCLVMQAKMAGRHLIMVFLDSAGKYSRIGDAERVRALDHGVGSRRRPGRARAHKPPL